MERRSLRNQQWSWKWDFCFFSDTVEVEVALIWGEELRAVTFLIWDSAYVPQVD
jgi:hypothetical protein